jgi:competence ComEA-like helix-hairpin-helix protein
MAFVVPDPGRPSPGTPIGRLARLLKPDRASPAPTKLRGESLSCYCFLALSQHVHAATFRNAGFLRHPDPQSCAFFRSPRQPPAHPIHINTANSSDLQQVPGIGPSTAQKILDTRKSYGTFKSVDDLLAIKGIAPKKLEKMRKYLTVGKPPSRKQSNAPQTAAHTIPRQATGHTPTRCKRRRTLALLFPDRCYL